MKTLGKSIDGKDLYARSIGSDVCLAFKRKRGAWIGLLLQFGGGQQQWAKPMEIRSRTTAKRWVDLQLRLRHKRIRGVLDADDVF